MEVSFNVNRLDIHNVKANKGYKNLPGNHQDFEKEECIYQISIQSKNPGDLEAIQKGLPKYCTSNISRFYIAGHNNLYGILWNFSIHIHNNNTGELNETAIKRRTRVIKHLKNFFENNEIKFVSLK